MTAWILKKTRSRYPGRTRTEECLRQLSTDRNIRELAEQYYAGKIRMILPVVIIGLCLSLYLYAGSGRNGLLTEDYFLPRKETAYQYELNMYTEENGKENISVTVEPRELTEEESRKLLRQAASEMEGLILGENDSLEEVRSDLNLVQAIEGTPITVEWQLDNYEVLNLDGSLRLENLTAQGSLTNLTARLVCEGEEEIYQAAVRVYPPVLSEEEKWKQDIDKAISEAQEESSGQELKKLPEKIGMIAVGWEETASHTGGAVLVLTLLTVTAVYVGKDRELEKQLREREQQMQRDYAGVVSKLVLLMGAGAAVRSAWEMIVKDYQKKREKGQIKYRYVYEEMSLACYEMQNGVSEVRAYENFGIRCRLPCYLKLTALLEQNLRKGGKGLSEILKAEVTEAFEQRKECALSQGEEASTRLLFPLVMMLGVVMLLILVPAGMSMQI